MIIAPVIAVVLVGSAVAAVTYRPAAAIDGVPCNTGESIDYHVHSHLDVFVDGKSVEVPASIGIPGCFYLLHTHSTDGIIHAESPVNRTFTLGQFMDIWAQTQPSSYNDLGLSDKPVSAYVDGQQVADYKSIEIQSKREIVLIIGNAPISIPKEYPATGPPA